MSALNRFIHFQTCRQTRQLPVRVWILQNGRGKVYTFIHYLRKIFYNHILALEFRCFLYAHNNNKHPCAPLCWHVHSSFVPGVQMVRNWNKLEKSLKNKKNKVFLFCSLYHYHVQIVESFIKHKHIGAKNKLLL